MINLFKEEKQKKSTTDKAENHIFKKHLRVLRVEKVKAFPKHFVSHRSVLKVYKTKKKKRQISVVLMLPVPLRSSE